MNSAAVALPNLVIAGAPKCGTSSVHDWLAAHPQALGSSPKETYYFVDPGTHMYDPSRHAERGLAEYTRFFRHADKTTPGVTPGVTFESTPAYLYSRTAREELHALPTSPRILFILREPSAQIYSGYTYFRENWGWVPSQMSFREYLEAVRTGSHDFKGNELARNALDYADYGKHLLPWRELYGHERVKVMLFEDLVRDQLGFMKELCRWLGIDGSFYDSYDFPRANESYAVRSPALQRINIAVRGLLAPFGRLYRPLRGLYRRLNTRKPSGPSGEEQAVLRQLRAEFVAPNARLAREFGLELSNWGEDGGTR